MSDLRDLLTSNTRFRADILDGDPPKALLVEELLSKWHAYAHETELLDGRYWSTIKQQAQHDLERLQRDMAAWRDCE